MGKILIIFILTVSLAVPITGEESGKPELPDGALASLGLGTVTAQNKAEIKQISPFVTSNPNDNIIASRSFYLERMELWDAKNLKKLATFEADFDSPSSVSFSPDGNLLASGGDDGRILFWDMKPYIKPTIKKQ